MSDYYTRWPQAFVLPEQRADTVAKVLVRDVVSRYGVPVVLHSDRGAIASKAKLSKSYLCY